MADTLRVAVALGLDPGNFSSGMTSAVRTVGTLTAASTAANVAVNALGVGLVTLGTTAAAATAGLGLATSKAGELQAQVAGIAAIRPDIDTSRVFSSLNLMQTRVGQSSGQLSASLENLFSSFEATQSEGLATVERFGRGAVAARTDALTFGGSVLGVLNAYGQTLDQVDHIQDVFFNTIRAGVVTGSELAQGLGMVTQPAKQAGLSVEALGGFIAGITREGGPAAQNINNLANLFAKFNTKETAEGFKLLGINTQTSTGQLRPMLDVLDELKGRLDRLTPASRASVIQQLFPDFQARTGLNVVLNQLDFIRTQVKENETSYGSAAKAYETMAATFQTQSQLLGQSVQAGFTFAGNAALPVLTAITSGVQTMVADSAPKLDEWQGRINAAFQVGGTRAWLTEVGEVAGELGRETEKWVPALSSWIEPAKTEVGNQLGVLWTGTIEPWVTQRRSDLGDKFNDEWAPALTEWLESPETKERVKTGLNAVSTQVTTWAETEGAAKFRTAAGSLARAFASELITTMVPNFNEIGRQLDAQQAQARNRALSNSEETLRAVAEAEARHAAAQGQSRAGFGSPADLAAELGSDYLAASTQAAEDIRAGNAQIDSALAGTSAPTSPGVANRPAHGGGTETVDLDAMRKAQAEAEAARKRAEAEAVRAAEASEREARRIQQRGIDLLAGFDRTISEGARAFQANMSREAAASAAAYLAVFDREAGESQGNALANSILQMIEAAEKVGVPNAQEMGGNIIDAARLGIVTKAPDLKAAGLEAIQQLSDAIKTANTLSPETFARALGTAQLRESVGSQFGGIWDAARRATEEGGQANIAALATATTGMASALFNNPALSIEQARAHYTTLMGTINGIVTGQISTTEAATRFAAANLDVQLAGARTRLEKELQAARNQLNTTIAQANTTASTAVARIQSEAATSAHRGQVFEGLAQAERNRTQDLRDRIDLRNQETQLERRNADLARDRGREDAAQTEARAKQLSDLQEQIRKQQEARSAQTTTSLSRKDTTFEDQVRALKRQWAAEDKAKADRRLQQDADQVAADERAAKDRAQATADLGLVTAVNTEFERARTGLQTVFADADRQSQIAQILGQRLTTVQVASTIYATATGTASANFADTETRLTTIQGLAGTVLTPMVNDANTIKGAFAEVESIIGRIRGNPAGPPSILPQTNVPSYPDFPVGGGTGGTPQTIVLEETIIVVTPDGEELHREVRRREVAARQNNQLYGAGATGQPVGVGGFGFGG